MARDYLASTASSCAAERIFSCAKDVCTSCGGILLAQTIEELVSRRIWLREGVDLGDYSADLTAAFKKLGIPMD